MKARSRNFGRAGALVGAFALGAYLSAQNVTRVTVHAGDQSQSFDIAHRAPTDSDPPQPPTTAYGAPGFAVLLLPQGGDPRNLANDGTIFHRADGVRRKLDGTEERLTWNVDIMNLEHMSHSGTVVGNAIDYFDGGEVAYPVYWPAGITEPRILPHSYVGPDPDEPEYRLAVGDGVTVASNGLVFAGTTGVGNAMNARSYPAVWRSPDEKPEIIAPFEGSLPFGVNSSGLIIGWIPYEADERYFVGAQTVSFIPHSLNDAGVVVGEAGNLSGGIYWQNGVTRSTGAFVGMAINARGDISGRIDGRLAFIPAEAVSDVLGDPSDERLATFVVSLAGTWHEAYISDMNDSGVVLGFGRRETAAGTAEWRDFLLVPAELAVDSNRDGVIATGPAGAVDRTTAERPFRFWVNDDDDDGDDKRSAADDIPLPEANSKRDSENIVVDGIRDLEDFFPVFLDIQHLLRLLPPGTNDTSYHLRQEDSALRVVFTNYTKAQALEYLRGSPAALGSGFGLGLAQAAGIAAATKITAEGVDITTDAPAFVDHIRNNDGGVLLVEASKATAKPLVFEVRQGASVVAEFKLELRIDPVETMFRYLNLRSFARGTPIAFNNQGPAYGSATPTAAPNDPFAAIATRMNLVFVHGYNVNGEAARGSAATAFKRFYWSGSKAKFYAVIWRGDDGQGAGAAPAGTTPDYHRNVGHAWQQGPLFRDFLDALQGDTAIMAHSLGNVVTQVALTRTRDPNSAARLIPASKPATVKHYFAVDAALPLEATSATDITSESKNRMRHSWWAEYDAQERLWPSHWHKLFEGTGDAREGLTWQNVFASLEVGTNFYSSGEEVLANPVDDGMPFWEPLFFAGLRSWVSQEKLKGGNGAAAPFFRSWTAGWVENKAWYVPIVPTPPFGSPQTRRRSVFEAQDVAAPKGVPTWSLASEPFFQRFQASEDGVFYPGYQGSRLHAPIGDTNADDEARKLVTVAKCLGEAIPALSFAQGSNSATKFNRLSGNFDLNTPNFKNGWPASRSPNTDWKHSDCLDVSYIFHFKFYDRMKTDGRLQ